MHLETRMAEDRTVLAEKWYEMVLGTYPPETQKIWKAQKDSFQNPVGSSLREATARLVDLLLEWKDAEAISVELDRIIRVRAVQDFKPSQALSFVFMLKRLIRDTYLEEIKQGGDLDGLLGLEAKIDNMALMALDLYSKCRQQVFDLKVQEIKKAQHNLLIRANMIVGNPV